jgi:hypothetical protein
MKGVIDMKYLLKIASLFLLTTHYAHALPITDADAFIAGDHKAIYETNTGLTWMDFGVNNNESFNQVAGELNTTYQGWRMPTHTEVMHLFGDLFQDNNWTVPNNPFYGSAKNSTPDITDIINIWGVNYQDPNWFLSRAYYSDNNILNFVQIDGSISASGIYLGADLLVCCNTPIPHLFHPDSIGDGTLLVHDSQPTATLPEPPTYLLLISGLLALFFSRRRRLTC